MCDWCVDYLRQMESTLDCLRVLRHADEMMAGDGAVRALSGAASTSAYIAARAAQQLDGSQGYAAERRWQSEWLVRRLGSGAGVTTGALTRPNRHQPSP